MRTDILGKQAENQSSDVLSSDLEEILKKYFSNDEANIKNIVEGTTGEETKLISKEDNNIKIDLSEIYSEEIKKVILAKDVLIPNENGTTPEEKSPYILYNNLLCRVLYNDDTHGLQIITNDNVTYVTLGADDPTVTADDFVYNGSLTLNDKFKKAATSYNNAVDTLNNKAKEYMGTKAIDARSVGSIATLGENGKFEGDTSDMWSSNAYQNITDYSLNGIFKYSPANSYFDDWITIKNLKINASNTIWLAFNYVISFSVYLDLRMYCMSEFTYDNIGFCTVFDNGNIGNIKSYSYGLRPVFLLSSDIIISRGDGSEENPYVIE